MGLRVRVVPDSVPTAIQGVSDFKPATPFWVEAQFFACFLEIAAVVIFRSEAGKSSYNQQWHLQTPMGAGTLAAFHECI